MAGHVEAGEMPGLVMLAARGDAVHVDAVGSPSFTDHSPLARSALFAIASLTKPITAVAALSLVEEGILHLERAVDDLLPELAHRPGPIPSSGPRPSSGCEVSGGRPGRR
jgi:CubicO group peptidase (beta-lactamase class C family)